MERRQGTDVAGYSQSREGDRVRAALDQVSQLATRAHQIGSFVLSDWRNRENDRRAELHQIITDYSETGDARYAEVLALRASELLIVLDDREASLHIAVASMLHQVRRRKIAQQHIDIAYSLPMPKEAKATRHESGLRASFRLVEPCMSLE